MGRWSASHWKTAVFGWLAFVVASFAIGNAVKTKQIDPNDVNVGQAHKADVMLRQAGFGQTDPQTEIVLIQGTGITVTSPAFRAAVNDVVHSVAPFTTIKNLRSPLDPAYADQVSPDGRTALVEWQMKGSADVAKTHIDAITSKVAAAAKRHPGSTSARPAASAPARRSTRCSTSSSKQAGTRSIPLTLAILVLVFGSLVAAGVPLLLALTAVFATMGLLAIPSHLVPMDQSVSAVVLLVGLAVGVDYALFYLKREREERAAGKGHRAALEAAAATSGRSVLISGVTVMIAMAGLLFTGDKTFVSFGVATMLVVAVAMIGSLTVLPGAPREARRPRREGPHPVPRPASAGRAARTASGRGSSRPP